MLTDLENHLLQLSRKMEQLMDSNKVLTASNLEMAQAINQQTMALHALAASNEEIVNVLAQAIVDDQGDGKEAGSNTLDPQQDHM